MSDIVERLEDMQERLVLSSDDDIIIFEAVSEIKKLRAALKPFADAADDFISEKHDMTRAIVSLGDLRAAAAALKEREMSEFSESIRAKYVTELFSKDCKPSDAMEFALKDTEAEIHRLRAENEKLRAAGEGVVKWWLEGGSMRLEGAPYCMFALRRALDGERAAAALKETGD